MNINQSKVSAEGKGNKTVNIKLENVTLEHCLVSSNFQLYLHLIYILATYKNKCNLKKSRPTSLRF